MAWICSNGAAVRVARLVVNAPWVTEQTVAAIIGDDPRGAAAYDVLHSQVFFSRQARSNGSRHACGATSWWMALGPQVPGA
jgi:hypothetical protein